MDVHTRDVYSCKLQPTLIELVMPGTTSRAPNQSRVPPEFPEAERQKNATETLVFILSFTVLSDFAKP